MIDSREERSTKSLGAIAAAILAVFGLTIAAYSPLFWAGFVSYDDPQYVAENALVNTGLTWANVRGAFTHAHMGNWYPLTLISYMAEIQVFGVRAPVHHATNIALHLGNVALLGYLLWRMTGGVWPSLIAAALFAVHPLSVEPVAWIASRKDVLSAFLALWSMHAYVRHARNGGAIAYAGALLLFGAALMAKASVVTVPGLLILADYWPLRRFEFRVAESPRIKRILIEKVPFVVIAAIMIGVTYFTQRDVGAVGGGLAYPLDVRMAGALTSAIRYLRQIAWPVDLAVFYPHRGAEIGAGETAAAVATLLVVTVLAILSARRLPEFFFGWSWFAVALAPACGLVQIGAHSGADRYVYIPQIGIYVVLAFVAARGVSGRRDATRISGTIVSLALAALAVSTFFQARHWRDSESLYRHALAVTDGNFRCHFNLANDLNAQGRRAEAEAHYREAITIWPAYVNARINLATLLGEAGRLPEAVEQLEAAYAIDANDPDVLFNLGIAYLNSTRFEDAVRTFDRFLALRPDDADATQARDFARNAIERERGEPEQ
ncbi:MAG: tetratricopeptide repeat protein [Candidatus Hydrogenedentota bacterium]